MREIWGKRVYETIHEVVHPDHTALIVVDMQNDFCSPKGQGGRRSNNLESTYRTVEPLRKLVETARRSGVRIVYLYNTVEPNRASVSPAWIYYQLRRGRAGPNVPLREPSGEGGTVEGTWGHQIIPELAPLPGDFAVRKNRPSGFTHTNLDKILRANGIETVVVTGVRTGSCVLATARDAQFYDYYTVVVEDCIAGVHPELDAAGMTILKDRCDILLSGDLLKMWSAAVPVSG